MALEEGFADDLVVVSVGGREVYRKDGVTTRMQIGRADSVEVPVDGGELEIAISLPRRGLEERVTARLDDRLYLGLSLEGDAIVYRMAEDPFGYV